MNPPHPCIPVTSTSSDMPFSTISCRMCLRSNPSASAVFYSQRKNEQWRQHIKRASIDEVKRAHAHDECTCYAGHLLPYDSTTRFQLDDIRFMKSTLICIRVPPHLVSCILLLSGFDVTGDLGLEGLECRAAHIPKAISTVLISSKDYCIIGCSFTCVQ